jgi:hypothetical protein
MVKLFYSEVFQNAVSSVNVQSPGNTFRELLDIRNSVMRAIGHNRGLQDNRFKMNFLDATENISKAAITCYSQNLNFSMHFCSCGYLIKFCGGFHRLDIHSLPIN